MSANEPELEEVLDHHRQKAPGLCEALTGVYNRLRAKGVPAQEAAMRTQAVYLASIGGNPASAGVEYSMSVWERYILEKEGRGQDV